MSTFSWLLKGNFFNFLILIFLFVWFCGKMNLSQKIEVAIVKIKDTLSASDNAKLQSVYTLAEAEDEVKNLPEELKKVEEDAKKSVDAFEKTTEAELESSKEQMKSNSKRIIENETQKASLALRKETARKALSTAREQALNNFVHNENLQRRLIAETIEKVEEINL